MEMNRSTLLLGQIIITGLTTAEAQELFLRTWGRYKEVFNPEATCPPSESNLLLNIQTWKGKFYKNKVNMADFVFIAGKNQAVIRSINHVSFDRQNLGQQLLQMGGLAVTVCPTVEFSGHVTAVDGGGRNITELVVFTLARDRDNVVMQESTIDVLAAGGKMRTLSTAAEDN